MKKNFLVSGLAAALMMGSANQAFAYPMYAQQGYENPREATGRIVCANCHLAQKPVDIEVPQAVLPDSVKARIVFASTKFEVLQALYAIASSTEEKSIELDFFSK